MVNNESVYDHMRSITEGTGNVTFHERRKKGHSKVSTESTCHEKTKSQHFHKDFNTYTSVSSVSIRAEAGAKEASAALTKTQHSWQGHVHRLTPKHICKRCCACLCTPCNLVGQHQVGERENTLLLRRRVSHTENRITVMITR